MLELVNELFLLNMHCRVNNVCSILSENDDLAAELVRDYLFDFFEWDSFGAKQSASLTNFSV